jgi:hypothetical protein
MMKSKLVCLIILAAFAQAVPKATQLKPVYENGRWGYADAFGRGERRNIRWGYVERGGREVIPMQFLNAGDFAEGLAAVNTGGSGDGKGEGSMCGTPSNYGYIDRTGAFVIKPQFTNASKFQRGRAGVSVGRITYVGRCLCCGPRFVGKHGSVDRSGTFVADETKDGAALEEDWEN